jgi:predicted metal-binding membrane protein
MISLRRSSTDRLGAALPSDRMAVLLGLIAVTAAAWIYLVLGTGIAMDEMDIGDGSVMAMMPAWTPTYAALVLLMWTVMMAAMMLPSAASTILTVAGTAPRRGEAAAGIAPALSFVAGYLMVWTGFSVAATSLQWALDSRHLLSETMAIGSARAAGLLVIAVGLYQMTPLKQTFLRHCRASDGCVAEDQRRTVPAMVRQGMRYGASCVGCCGVLMCLLFVGGMMNALWLAGISLWVLAEKTLPWGSGIARLAGAGLIAWGTVSLAIALS